MAYDSKCYELAEAFLEDDPTLNTFDKIHHLASHIQRAVEDWIEMEHMEEQTQGSDLYSPTVKRVAKKFSDTLRAKRRGPV